MPSKKSPNLFPLIVFFLFMLFSFSPLLGGILVLILIMFFLEKKNKNPALAMIFSHLEVFSKTNISSQKKDPISLETNQLLAKSLLTWQTPLALPIPNKTRLDRKKRYLQIALNSTLEEAREILLRLPVSERILIEAGTPLIKEYGEEAISQLKIWAPPQSYIVADNKCADLGAREVEIMANAGVNAATCLGVAPIETIDSFIVECQKFNIDSMIDMMNVSDVLSVLKKLKKLPTVVILHRGVDETEFSREKQIPYYQIKQIKGNYRLLVAVAGGDTIKEIQRAFFNDADIVVAWKNFYQFGRETAQMADLFLKETN